MDIQKRSEQLRNRCEQFKKMDKFYDAVALHYQLNLDIYKMQPLFYKIILQESRYNIVQAICCVIFGRKANSVSQIKEIFDKYKIASPNSVIAIIALLKTTGRLSTWRDDSDRRKVLLESTEKGIQDLKFYLRGGFAPLNLLFPELELHEDLLDDEQSRCSFFSRATDMMFNGIVYRNILPDSSVFLDKDGGRMIMLHLWLRARKESQENRITLEYSQKKLAKEFAVSRTHIRRLFLDALDNGLCEIHEGSRITLLPAFFDLVENYSGIYFAWVLDYLNIHPASLISGEK
ncbi:MarR family transcriptional regulator [Enterobacteriaceae bacterium YMB-R22]|uniref:MarR family transcriptional regulator n=3 Tax=Enterobacteriaceae TaxID=543 RepID=A0A8K0V6R5_9ENTR|nr:MarR family transcriptional regulator [Tenebrionibacter intestinalis]MBV4414369.1 MarR family transcriptional regulator [Tenebrionicola larvae]MBV5096938.1 MarR family transcriptional regulator [Tenebrionicola larvae]